MILIGSFSIRLVFSSTIAVIVVIDFHLGLMNIFGFNLKRLIDSGLIILDLRSLSVEFVFIGVGQVIYLLL